ncbi:MAG: tRNA (adenosine(37)-N6)-dimethylallyltransferase MiaA [Candidatus Pacebacteria bacterium]|nr:tRNA (adenosine(37)-N6)-dimethylallyltransferase MiaA [Candidatus Paceibacterota bacterium]
MNILSRIKNLFIKKPKIIVVLGQTSTGKSDLAVEIAQKYNGEIISADSRQVYCGMDLGSGKITTKEMQGVPHYLLDVANPIEIFDVQKYQKLGTEAIYNIHHKNKTPIICGGTGFYIDNLIYQTQFSSVKSNSELREKLEKKSLEELQKLYKAKTSTMKFWIRSGMKNKIDIKNPVRIIRALEIIEELSYIPKIKKNNPYNILFIGLTIPKKDLDRRIYKRIIDRLEIGMLSETHALLENGVTHKRLQSLGLEYKFMSKHILGEISYEEMIDQLYRATVQFAKRQKTWFKRNKNIHWFNSFENRKNMHNLINNFLK